MATSDYWFRRKRYGYGLSPANGKGWLLTIAAIALVIADFYRLDIHSNSVSDTVRPFVIDTILIVIVFLLVAYWKGEKPLKGQWGKEKDEENIDK